MRKIKSSSNRVKFYLLNSFCRNILFILFFFFLFKHTGSVRNSFVLFLLICQQITLNLQVLFDWGCHFPGDDWIETIQDWHSNSTFHHNNWNDSWVLFIVFYYNMIEMFKSCGMLAQKKKLPEQKCDWYSELNLCYTGDLCCDYIKSCI